VKNAPKKKRLVVAGSSRSDNSKDLSSAAVNLLGGGKKVVESESDKDERSVSTASDVSDSATITNRQEKSIDESRTVRYEQSQQSLVHTSESSSTNNNGNKNDDDRKAIQSTTAGINLQLNDPKERVLVRHATASSSYSVDDFKGKKKKIIKPWSAGRKKNKRKQNNTGGIGRDGYGEDLEVEVKNAPKDRRLVMARISSSGGTHDAAKALISGGVKAKAADPPPASINANKEGGKKMDDDDDNESGLISHVFSGKTIDGTMDESERGPSLKRHIPTKSRDEPNLIRHIPTEPTHFEGEGEPSLVRHVVVAPAATENIKEEELKVYVHGDVSEEDQIEEKGVGEEKEQQSLVKEILASSSESSLKGPPKLVRANIVEAKVEDPKLVRATILNKKEKEPKLVRAILVREIIEEPKVVRANVQEEKLPEKNLLKHKEEKEPKLVRANVVHEIVDKPKLVRANVQKENLSKQNLWRPKTEKDITSVVNLVKPDQMGRKEDASVRRRLVSPPSSTTSMNDIPVADLMYGAKPATVSPTVVPIEVKSKKLVKPTFTIGSASTGTDSASIIETKTTMVSDNPDVLMYDSRTSTIAPSSVPVDSIARKLVRPMTAQVMDDLLYGPKQATISPATVRFKVKPKQKIVNPLTSTVSPTTVRFKVNPKQKIVNPPISTMIATDNMYGSGGNISTTGTSPTSVPIEIKPKKLVKSESVAYTMMDDLMYGSNRATTSPTAVTYEPKLKKFINPPTETSAKASTTEKLTSSENTSTIFPDGDVRKIPEIHRLIRASPSMRNVAQLDGLEKPDDKYVISNVASKERRYVKLSDSIMKSAINWDAANSNPLNSNPTSVNLDMSPKKKVTNVPHHSIKRADVPKNKKDLKEDGVKEMKSSKVYVQPTSSVMDNALNWDAVEPAITTSNPAIVNVDMPVSKKEATSNDDEKEGNKTGVRDKIKSDSRSKKNYVQSTTSVMKNVPDWDAVEAAVTTSNPAVVNIDIPVSRKAIKSDVGEKKEQNTDVKEVNVKEEENEKNYVQLSTSVMNNVPDWDLCQPAITTSNPAVVNVDIPMKKGKNVDLVKDNVKNIQTKKKYIQPTASVMNNVPDWDLCQSAISTSNPAVVNVDGSKYEEEQNLIRAPSSSRINSTTDDANRPSNIVPRSTNGKEETIDLKEEVSRTPAAVETKKQQIKPKRKVASTRPAPADTPFEYKQLQSIPKDTNPAVAKPIRDEETKTKTKLPAAIAHAAGSSKSLSGGWIPTAHFPTKGENVIFDENSSSNQDSDIKDIASSERKTQSDAMKSPDDPDALPRPKGIIPLTASSSAKEKSQLFRAEHALAPVNDDDEYGDDEKLNRIETISKKGSDIGSNTPGSQYVRKIGSSTNSMLGPDQQTLPNPSGVIFPNVRPVTTAALADPTKSKLEQRSKPDHSVGDIAAIQEKALSQEGDTSNSKEKKIFLYDGGYPQPKEPWDFGMKGFDMKLDENKQQASSKTKKKLVAYDGSKVTGGAICDNVEESVHVSSDVLPLDKNIL